MTASHRSLAGIVTWHRADVPTSGRAYGIVEQVLIPSQEFDTLGGFKRFSEVLAIGLQAGRDTLQKWKAEGILPTGLVDEVKGAVTIKRGARIRRMSI